MRVRLPKEEQKTPYRSTIGHLKLDPARGEGSADEVRRARQALVDELTVAACRAHGDWRELDPANIEHRTRFVVDREEGLLYRRTPGAVLSSVGEGDGVRIAEINTAGVAAWFVGSDGAAVFLVRPATAPQSVVELDALELRRAARLAEQEQRDRLTAKRVAEERAKFVKTSRSSR